jgi:hypothetical protein
MKVRRPFEYVFETLQIRKSKKFMKEKSQS